MKIDCKSNEERNDIARQSICIRRADIKKLYENRLKINQSSIWSLGFLPRMPGRVPVPACLFACIPAIVLLQCRKLVWRIWEVWKGFGWIRSVKMELSQTAGFVGRMVLLVGFAWYTVFIWSGLHLVCHLQRNTVYTSHLPRGAGPHHPQFFGHVVDVPSNDTKASPLGAHVVWCSMVWQPYEVRMFLWWEPQSQIKEHMQDVPSVNFWNSCSSSYGSNAAATKTGTRIV